MEPLRMIVVEDEPLYRDLLVGAVVSRIPFTEVVGSFATAEESLEQASRLKPDVLLTDIDLGPGMTGPNLAIEMRRSTTARGVVLLSNLALPTILTTMPVDVQGGWSYLLKTSVSTVNELGRAIFSASVGDVFVDGTLVEALVARPNTPMDTLTPRQMGVLERMARGLSNRAISEELDLSPRTVESVVSDIFTNLDIRQNSENVNPRVRSVLMYLDHTAPRPSAGILRDNVLP